MWHLQTAQTKAETRGEERSPAGRAGSEVGGGEKERRPGREPRVAQLGAALVEHFHGAARGRRSSRGLD